MEQTAVGLFANEVAAESVTEALIAGGIFPGSIRVLVEPEWMPVLSLTSTPHNDFELALVRDLLSMGAPENDAEALAHALRHGHALVFATGTLEEANAAVDILNSHGAIEVEELAAELPLLPVAHCEEAARREGGIQVGRIRSKGDGARLFVW